MITLRPYQQDLINRTKQSMLTGHKAPLLVAPCGSGKTVIFSYFSKQIISKTKRVLILVHREELLEQVSETLRKFNVGHTFIAPNRYFSARSLVHVASVFTLVRNLSKLPPPDVIIIDEAHHGCRGSTWDKILQAYPNAWRIGVTASPIRLSGESLGDIFDDLIIGPSTEELILAGQLCPYKLYCSEKIDTSKLHTVAGDFNKQEANDAMDKPVITGNAVEQYTKYAKGKRTVVFCCSIKHSENVAAEFEKSGYSVATIDGKMDSITRRRVVNDFRTGAIQILTSVNVISEGFDLPAIECAIILRPTQSIGLWIQMTGRALRNAEGKDTAIILDQAGNTERLQWLPCSKGEWNLNAGKNKKEINKELKIKLCPECYGATNSWRKNCPYCGFEFTIESREVDQVEGDLKEIDIEAIRKQKKMEQGRAGSYEELVEIGKQRQYKNPSVWAKFVLKARKKKAEW